jgi:hypothetical protein
LLVDSTTPVHVSRLAVHTIVDIRHILLTFIVTDDVLPGVTPFAKDCVTIIIFEAADAFDGIIFFGCGGVRGPVCDFRRRASSADRRVIRGGVRDGEGGGICHNPTDDPLSDKSKMLIS